MIADPLDHYPPADLFAMAAAVSARVAGRDGKAAAVSRDLAARYERVAERLVAERLAQ
jgi:hypothetical protein